MSDETPEASLTVAAGFGGAVALVVAFRKQRILERDETGERERAAAQRADAAAAREVQKAYLDRYGAAAAQLGHEDPTVRLAGVYALANLADEWAAQRQQCVDVLCAHLRLPWQHQPDTEHPLAAKTIEQTQPAPAATKTTYAYPNDAGETEVRKTILRVIADHLRDPHQNPHPEALLTPGPWSDLALDFTGAALPALNWTRTAVPVRTLFDEATFTGDAGFGGATFSGDAGFGGATFSGDAMFDGATFTGDAWFRGATFTGDAGFGGATFTGDAGFGGATFTGGAGFGGATFTGGAWFERATFTGGAWFGGATFSGSAWFGGATFSGGAWFGGATFTGGAMFDGATFTGGAWFGGATFTGGAWFGGATFTGDAMFDWATFTGGARFDGAKFTGDARFDGATFTGDASFREATFSRAPVGLSADALDFSHLKSDGSD